MNILIATELYMLVAKTILFLSCILSQMEKEFIIKTFISDAVISHVLWNNMLYVWSLFMHTKFRM
jgi:hypothetical protein